MICSMILFVWAVIQHTWPYQCPPPFWSNSEVEPIEVGASSGLNIVQVEEDRQNSYSLLPFNVVRNVVVVTLLRLVGNHIG
jgi:hypothetical protein